MATKKSTSTLSQADRRILRVFGDRVREIRTKKGLAVDDVSGVDMGIKDGAHWRRIENGQKNINLTTVYKMAACLRIEADQLFKRGSSL